MTPLILLHGFTGSPEGFSPLIQALEARGFNATCCHAPWLPGHGPLQEEAEGGPLDFTAQVERLATTCLPEGETRRHLLGYSMGARLALALLVRFPSRFSGATLIGVHPGLSSPEERGTRIQADARWVALLEEQGLGPFVERWESQPLFASQTQLPMSTQAARRAQRLTHRPQGLAFALRCLGLGAMPPLGDRLAEIPCPVQLVAGAQDAKFLELAQRLSSQFPKATVYCVPSVGHDVVLEAPSQLADILMKGLNDD